jgi:hypothetical protein
VNKDGLKTEKQANKMEGNMEIIRESNTLKEALERVCSAWDIYVDSEELECLLTCLIEFCRRPGRPFAISPLNTLLGLGIDLSFDMKGREYDGEFNYSRKIEFVCRFKSRVLDGVLEYGFRDRYFYEFIDLVDIDTSRVKSARRV